MSKTFRSMSAQHRIKHCGTLHSSKELPRTRMKLLSLLREQNNASIMIIRFNKRMFYALLKDKVAVLYNYIVNILLDRLITQKLLPIDEPIYFIASRRETNKSLNANFKSDLLQRSGDKIKLVVEIKSPQEEKGLQVVDCISWAAFAKYEHGDESYFTKIKELVVEDNQLFS